MIIITNQYKKWVLAEDNCLKENYGKMSVYVLAKKLDRTWNSVSNRATKLGLPCKLNWWSKKEIDFLSTNYPTMKVKDLAKKLKRSKSSVQQKISHLHLRKGITEEKRKKILELTRTTNFSYGVIGQKVGISSGSVSRILRELGIKGKVGAKGVFPLLKGFKYLGKSNVLKHRAELLYVYHLTCWDCKKTFVSEKDLQVHHDFTRLPVQVIVLCKLCHGKRHNKNMKF